MQAKVPKGQVVPFLNSSPRFLEGSTVQFHSQGRQEDVHTTLIAQWMAHHSTRIVELALCLGQFRQASSQPTSVHVQGAGPVLLHEIHGGFGHGTSQGFAESSNDRTKRRQARHILEKGHCRVEVKKQKQKARRWKGPPNYPGFDVNTTARSKEKKEEEVTFLEQVQQHPSLSLSTLSQSPR